MTEPAVLYERRDAIVELTLNRPDNRNAMTPELLAAFDMSLDRLEGEPGVRAVVISGRGPSFCGGADFRSTLLDEPSNQEDHYSVYAPFMRVLDIPVPVVAAMAGHAVGGGFGLATVCDIRVVAEDARYGANFVKLGLSPGMAISYLLPRLVGLPRAMEYLVTGRLFDGVTAHRIGYANHVMPADRVDAAARALASEIGEASPAAVLLTKRAVMQGLGWDAVQHGRAEAVTQAAMIQRADFREGVDALLRKRTPRFGEIDGPLPDD